MEVRESNNRQVSVYATRDFVVGDVICQEEAPLLRLSPLPGTRQKEILIKAWEESSSLDSTTSSDKKQDGSSSTVAAAAKKDDSNAKPSLWESIVVPSSVPDVYHGTFKGMVQAALCWLVLYDDEEQHKEQKKRFLKLYAPSLQETPKEEVDIVNVARQAYKYLSESGVKRLLTANEEEKELLTVMLIWTCNSFEQGRVYELMSRFNHSCNPNAVVQPVQENGQQEGQRIVAAAPIAVGQEICISYLGLLLYAERSVRRKHLQQTKHFACTCTRCCGVGDSMAYEDVAASIPCWQCHQRVGRQLDEDTQYDDEGTVNYVAPKQEENDLIYHCTECNTRMSIQDQAYSMHVVAGQKVVDKTVLFLRDYQRHRQSDNDHDDDQDEDDVQDELIDQHIRMASSVLGARHWTTNLLLLLQVDRNLQSMHGAMLTSDDSKSSSSPDLESIAATVDILERTVSFVKGLNLKLHMGHMVGDAIIGLARTLVALGDVKSQKYAAEWLDKISDDYVQHFTSPGLQKVVQTLQMAWQQSGADTAKPPAKKARR